MRRRWFAGAILFLSAVFIGFIVFSSILHVEFKLLVILLLPIIIISEILFFLKEFVDWVIDGFKLHRDLANHLVEHLRLLEEVIRLNREDISSLYKTLQNNPDALKEIKEKNPSFSLDAIKGSTRAMEKAGISMEDFNKLKNDVDDIGKNLHPFRISLYSIFVGVSVGVVLFVVGVLFLKMPFLK